MSPRLRLVVFVLSLCLLVPAGIQVARHMPVFGAHANPYGDAINAVGTAERHVTNMVSAVNFDYRGIDTLGEEFMLLCAVTGTVMLLRGSRGEGVADRPAPLRGRPIVPHSEAMALYCRVTAPLVVLFGAYVALHAMTTPGGGFQGGVIIATGLLMAGLGDGYPAWRRIVRSEWLGPCEGIGAALYGLCGFAGLALGHDFLTNFLPLGHARDVFSGGLMQVENLGVTLAVTGGFGLLFLEFLEETRSEKPEDAP
jgi:multicomponent Na+:H+ antiporter subunit B